MSIELISKPHCTNNYTSILRFYDGYLVSKLIFPVLFAFGKAAYIRLM